MALALADLTKPMTTDEVKASIYKILGLLGVPTTSWKPGAVARAIISCIAVVLSAFTALMAEIAKSGFLELAEKDWLTLVAKHVFGVDRIEASFATGVVTLVNSGGGIYPLGVGDLVISNPTSKRTYTNTAPISLGAGATLTGVAVQAQEVGSGSTSAPNTITQLETSLLGVTVTNPDSVIGLDAETDPALRTRCLERLSSLSPNGPRGAYAYFAKIAKRASGETIGVTRVRVSANSSTGQVSVLVATATGAITGDVDDPDTDLGAINKAIQENVVPDGITATIASATALSIAVTYEVWIYSTSALTAGELQALIATKLTDFMSTQPIAGNIIAPASGKVFHDAIRTAIGATRPEIFHVAVTVPAADTTVAGTEVPVLGAVTCTAVNVVTL
jgi:phage-related baseplate assembly protein